MFALCLAVTARAQKDSSADLDDFKAAWGDFNREGRYAEFVEYARPWFCRASDGADTSAFVYSGITLSMAFLSLDEPDSVRKYLDAVSPCLHSGTEPRILLTYNFIRGTYSLKREYNYPKALDFYQKCYEIAAQSEDTDNSIAALLNIVHIYYVRSDNRAIEQARQAYRLSRKEGTDELAVCMANTAMGEMLYLSGSLDSALCYSSDALRIAENTDYASIYSDLHLLLADIYASMWRQGRQEDSSLALAERHYGLAIDNSAYAETGTLSMLYLHYGHLAEDTGDKDKAVALYRKGLDVSLNKGNLEFRRELYRRIADLSYQEGNHGAALGFYRSYAFLLDSVASQSKEFQFDSLLLANQNMEHREELNLKEIALLKANRNNLITGSVLALVLIAAVSIWILYRRQRNMYRVLFARYRDYAARVKAVSETSRLSSSQADKEIFLKLEEKMKNEKLYRMKDISVDKVSEILGTNRTYLSKSVNKWAGMSFPAYVNSYRIREATSVISDPGRDVPMKVLADELGFNSLSVFYKVFQKETGLTPSRYRKENDSSSGSVEDL